MRESIHYPILNYWALSNTHSKCAGVLQEKITNKCINKQMCTQLRIIVITSSTNVLQNTLIVRA